LKPTVRIRPRHRLSLHLGKTALLLKSRFLELNFACADVPARVIIFLDGGERDL